MSLFIFNQKGVKSMPKWKNPKNMSLEEALPGFGLLKFAAALKAYAFEPISRKSAPFQFRNRVSLGIEIS